MLAAASMKGSAPGSGRGRGRAGRERRSVDAVIVEHDDFPVELRVLGIDLGKQTIGDALDVGLDARIGLDWKVLLHREPFETRLPHDFLFRHQDACLGGAQHAESRAGRPEKLLDSRHSTSLVRHRFVHLE